MLISAKVKKNKPNTYGLKVNFHNNYRFNCFFIDKLVRYFLHLLIFKNHSKTNFIVWIEANKDF